MLHSWITHIPEDVADRVMLELGDVVHTGAFRGGPFTPRLERQIGDDFSAFGVGVRSGMDGIELILESLGIRDRRVLVPANCFQAIPAMVARLGGTLCPFR